MSFRAWLRRQQIAENGADAVMMSFGRGRDRRQIVWWLGGFLQGSRRRDERGRNARWPVPFTIEFYDVAPLSASSL